MFSNFQLKLSLPTSHDDGYRRIATSSPSSPSRLPGSSSPSRRGRRRRSSPLLVVSAAAAVLLFLATLIHMNQASQDRFDAFYSTAVDRLDRLSDQWDEYMPELDRVVSRPLQRGKAWFGGTPSQEAACLGWDVNREEEHDPVGCVRARQYRQVMRVWDREIKGDHGHWWFTRKVNLVTFEKLQRCFLPFNHENVTACPDRPVIINGYWWSALVSLNGTSGESIWQESILKQFDTFGVMTLFLGDYPNWIAVAEMMPDVYRFIWGPEVEIVSCITDPRCVAAEHYVPPEEAEDLSIGVPREERGVIPIWRLQIVDYPKEVSNNDYYWDLENEGEWSYHPLGTQWIQVPWDMPGHVHLPYSIEEYCLKLPILPHEQRNNSVLIFAKRSSYFHMGGLSPQHFWTDLAAEPDFELLSTAEVEEGSPMPDGLETMGRQGRDQYEALVGGVKVLLGMGFPPISPSVYTALCQGTPVVLPYRVKGKTVKKGGWGMYSGHFQHGPAMAIGPPYVYSWYSRDYADLLEKVNLARETPIERYIPDNMRLSYALERSEAFLNRDLYSMFRKVVRKNGGKVPALIAGARERCLQLKRCKEPLAEGRIPFSPERMRFLEQAQAKAKNVVTDGVSV